MFFVVCLEWFGDCAFSRTYVIYYIAGGKIFVQKKYASVKLYGGIARK